MSFLLNKVVSFPQDIWEQRLPLEPSGGVPQPVPVHLWAAPECPIRAHWSLRAASSLRTGWWERSGLHVTPSRCFHLLGFPVLSLILRSQRGGREVNLGVCWRAAWNRGESCPLNLEWILPTHLTLLCVLHCCYKSWSMQTDEGPVGGSSRSEYVTVPVKISRLQI